MIGWAMHHIATRWCVVVEKHDSIVTACRGRWSATDNYEITKGDPPIADRCSFCQAAYASDELARLGALIAEDVCRVTVGLDELRDATPLVDVAPRFAFDMSDDAGGEA